MDSRIQKRVGVFNLKSKFKEKIFKIETRMESFEDFSFECNIKNETKTNTDNLAQPGSF